MTTEGRSFAFGSEVNLERNSSSSRICTFVAVCYLLSWSCWFLARSFHSQYILISLWGFQSHIYVQFILLWVGNVAPTVGLLFTLAILSNSLYRKELLQSVRNVRVPLRYYLFAILLPSVAFLIADLVRELFGAPTFFTGRPSLWLRDILLNVALVPLWEELGWRGFLLPELQKQRGTFAASLWVGLIWGVWHLPIRIHNAPVGSSPAIFLILFVIYIVGLSVILAWLYYAAGRSIWPGVLLHTAANSADYFIISPETNRYGSLWPVLGAVISIWIVAAVTLFIDSKTGGIFFGRSSVHEPRT
jgi:membrane protease YdiL (CAAX protease family)